MEFPRLGQQCREPTCQQLDFLPMKCDACSNIFCRDHIVYATHSCSESYKKNNQVPICPLCSLPCPIRKGESPDMVVGKHIESDCLSDPAKSRRKVYTNRCSKKGCKKKELVPVVCQICQLNFCFHHRHQQDHDCKGFENSGKSVSNAGLAAIFRGQIVQKAPTLQAVNYPSLGQIENSKRVSHKTQPGVETGLVTFQGNMNDEATARAVQESMTEGSGHHQQSLERMTSKEDDDFLLAQAIALSLQDMLLSPARRSQTTVKA